MDPAQIAVGEAQGFVVKSEIDGTTEIAISDLTPKKMTGLKVYRGFVQSGTECSVSVEALIFAYNCSNGADEIAKTLHKQCSTFDHPNVMRSLGFGRAMQNGLEYMFVAFPTFDRTFNDYLRQASGATEMGRFSIPFIQIVSDIVCGLEALSENGFGCPTLRGIHIAIKEEGNSTTAKIWNFSACSDKSKDKSWAKLGQMLLDVGHNNSAYGADSFEIDDMCSKMINGKLKGMDILKQSALLNVREKFENVLGLWRYVSVNCMPQLVQQGNVQGQTSKHTLVDYLDLKDTVSKRPQWIDNIRRTKSPKTFRELVEELRDIIEHECEYISPSMTRELSFKEKLEGKVKGDLEHSIRKAWAKDFLKIQLWASDPTAKL